MTNRPDWTKKHGTWLYFNDLAVTPGKMHGQALATEKIRLCGALPAKGFVAIASCLAKAFALRKMRIKGSATRIQ